MDMVLLILAVLFLLWRVNNANDEAFSHLGNRVAGLSEGMSSEGLDTGNAGMDYESPFGRFQGSSLLAEDAYESTRLHLSNDDQIYTSRHSHDDCDISRAMWDPSCPLYHAFHHDDWHSYSTWDDSWSSSSSWDDSWSSSSWDSWSSSNWDS